VLNNPDLSTHVYAVSRDLYNSFWFETEVVAFFSSVFRMLYFVACHPAFEAISVMDQPVAARVQTSTTLQGLGNFIIRLMPSRYCSDNSSIAGPGKSSETQCGAAVGNSPLILDESSDHGLGQRYEDIWMQLVIVPKTRQRFRPRNV
jgi:hypothetical protein